MHHARTGMPPLLAAVLLLAGPGVAQEPTTAFPETVVPSGTPAAIEMTAYRTTMIADGRDETILRMFVVDSAGRRIATAERTLRLRVEGDASIDRAAGGYPLTRGVDEKGVRYWDTRLVRGSSAVILRAGNTVDRIRVSVESDSLPPSGHEIHTIPADARLLEPTRDQLRDLVASRRPVPRMIGADVSFVPQLEARDVHFMDGGQKRDPLRILADHGFNFIRLRVFVNPEDRDGYAPGTGWAGLDHTKRMARRIHDAGMKFLLDFHYSDYWADPQQQNKPAAWRHLDPEQLQATMRAYTTDVLRQLAAQGTAPDMVQVGNEINHGLLWPDGHVSNLDGLAALLRAGVAGVRDADPSIPVMMHLALGGQNEEAVFWLDNMIARGVRFDVIGLSFYPRWHGTLDDLNYNVRDLVRRYGLPVNVVEYGQFASQVNAVVFGLPDGMGVGTAAWEPLGGFFDRDTRAPTDRLLIYDQLSAKYLGGR